MLKIKSVRIWLNVWLWLFRIITLILMVCYFIVSDIFLALAGILTIGLTWELLAPNYRLMVSLTEVVLPLD